MRKLLTTLLLAMAFNAHAQKTTSLPSAAWNNSEWISVVNAPIASGRADKTLRTADGASWFVTDVVNDNKVISAKWMTAGLGVYELYVNGKSIGQEILKPGFTH